MTDILRIREPLVESTMDAVLDHVSFLEDHPQGLVVFSADRQLSGRGREGRVWITSGKAVATSIALKMPRRNDPTILQLLAVAVVEALGGLYRNGEFGIKWPNDVLLQERKVGGLIAEFSEEVVVLGLGLNLQVPENEFPKRPLWPAGSIEYLLGTAVEYEPSQVVEAVLTRFLDKLTMWTAQGFGAIRADFTAKLLFQGQSVEVGGLDERLRGVLDGINDRGELLIKQKSGLVCNVAVGEILFSS